MLLEEELVGVVSDTEDVAEEPPAELFRISKALQEGTKGTNEEVDITGAAKVSVSMVLSKQLHIYNIPTSWPETAQMDWK